VPELPDITAYVEALEQRITGSEVLKAAAFSPFVMRTYDPPLEQIVGQRVQSVSRLGKRIVLRLEGERFLVFHLMISGRFRWHEAAKGRHSVKATGRVCLAAFEFTAGTLLLVEVSAAKRASIHLVRGQEALHALDPGGLEVLEARLSEFRKALLRENRTLKRALTNPAAFSGIGNAYSDEILHAARLSPLRLTHSLSNEEVGRLHAAAQVTLADWTARLRVELAGRFPGPGEVTAFRESFAAHGKFGKPCPVCGLPIQRIRYAENETNYCAKCQNEGRLLADRALSRLLKDDWPKTIEEMVGG
jgi:formamidopyrimidine-DNA glycosylase